jgi:MHS family proline/betaine transporter-like MFS transporter
MAIFGGTAPLVSTWLIKVSGGNILMPAYYLIATAIIAIITLLFMPETYKKELD